MVLSAPAQLIVLSASMFKNPVLNKCSVALLHERDGYTTPGSFDATCV